MEPGAPNHEDLKKIAESVKTRTKYRPRIGIICGSGLGGLADQVTEADSFDYKDIGGFPTSTGEWLLLQCRLQHLFFLLLKFNKIIT